MLSKIILVVLLGTPPPTPSLETIGIEWLYDYAYALVVEVADLFRKEGFYDTSNKYYSRAQDQSEIKHDQQLQCKVLTFIAPNYLLLENFIRAKRMIQRSLKGCTDKTFRPLHLFGLVTANFCLGTLRKAKSCFQQIREEYPHEKHMTWAAQLLAQER